MAITQVGETTNSLLKKLVSATNGLSGGGGIFLTEAEANALYFRLDGSNSPLTATSATVVTVPDAFSLTSLGSIALTAGGTNENITLTPSGTGAINLNTGSGGVRLPNTATSGLQLYNTADQTTNYERLEALWSSNVASLRVRYGTAASQRNFVISNDIFNAAGFGPAIAFDAGNRQLLFYATARISTLAASASGSSTLGFRFTGINSTATSGTSAALSITPTYNQASGTAANTDLLINRTETAVGSGVQYIIQAQNGGADQMHLTRNGRLNVLSSITIGQVTSDTSRLLITNNVSSTAWGTNGRDIRVAANTYTDSSTASSGTAASAVFSSFAQPTLAATNTSVTTTDAATVYIANAPAAGTNQTITNPYAFWVDAGNTRLDGALITTPQALSGAGAVNVTTTATDYTSTGGAQALTLANGTVGQIKTITHVVDGGSGVLTPTTAIGFTTITFTNVGDSATLRYTSAGWAIIGIFGAVAA